MIEENALVTAVTNDNHITVRSEIKSTCSSCQQVDTCGSGQVAKAFPQKHLEFQITCHLPVTVGDKVVLGLSDKMLLSSAWQVYCWPLLGLIFSSFLGQWLLEQQILPHEIFAITFGVLGGYTGFSLAKKHQQKPIIQQALAPVVVRVVPTEIPVINVTS